MHHDARGLVISTASAKAAAAFDHLVTNHSVIDRKVSTSTAPSSRKRVQPAMFGY